MKIIKQGAVKPKTQTHTCKRCSTKFEYDKKDVQLDFRDGDYVVCPKCGAFIASKL